MIPIRVGYPLLLSSPPSSSPAMYLLIGFKEILVLSNTPLAIFYDHEGILLRSIWLEGWKSWRIENGGRIKKSEDREDFNFFPFCLVGSGKVEGWKK